LFLEGEDYKPQEWPASSDTDESEGLYEPIGPGKITTIFGGFLQPFQLLVKRKCHEK